MSTVDMHSVEAFYDDFVRKLLTDYAHGNPRIEAAIGHVLRSLAPDTKAVLDVGCGLGWTSTEISAHLPSASVTGIDLSGGNIETAAKLFVDESVGFKVVDVTDPTWVPDASFDAIVMCDVYEHIPDSSRAPFNAALSRILADDGVVVLTFPSESHQQHLHDHDPGGLQPIDEVITPATLVDLAKTLGGSLESFDRVTIWRPDDYVHAVVRCGPRPQATASEVIAVEPSRARQSRIAVRLNVRITPDGYMIPLGSGPATLVVSPNRGQYSETFIRNHIEHLPGPVEVLFGVTGAYETEDQDPLVGRSWRIAGKVGRKALGSEAPWRHVESRALARFCAERDVQVVLAEFGPTAAMLSDTLEGTGIPVVAHFHGYDAHRQDILDEWLPAYRRMFKRPGAIVVVSNHMRAQLIGLGAPEQVVHVVRCGVDTDTFAAGDPGSAPPSFVSVGRFVDKKAPHLVVLAFARALEECREIVLTMVGDGPLLESTQQMAASLAVGDSIEFATALPQHAVAHLMRGARAFVQHSIRTSLGDSEGTPVAVMEAMSTGLPVIATRHAGIGEVIDHGVTGLLSEEGDIGAMAKHIVALARDPELAAKLGAEGASVARPLHSTNERIRQLERILATTRDN